MFDKLSPVAEQAAINISRRQFFGRLGRVAMVVTTAAGGLLMLPGDAKAAGRVCGNTYPSPCWQRKLGDPCAVPGERGVFRCRGIKGSSDCDCR